MFIQTAQLEPKAYQESLFVQIALMELAAPAHLIDAIQHVLQEPIHLLQIQRSALFVHLEPPIVILGSLELIAV